jgi:hypothetical protein
MAFSIDDYDPAWSDMKKPVKVWATSKVTFNRYISDTKVRYNILLSLESNLHFSELDHVDIVRDEARYHFMETVNKDTGQIITEDGKCFDYCKNRVSALYLSKNK